MSVLSQLDPVLPNLLCPNREYTVSPIYSGSLGPSSRHRFVQMTSSSHSLCLNDILSTDRDLRSPVLPRDTVTSDSDVDHQRQMKHYREIFWTRVLWVKTEQSGEFESPEVSWRTSRDSFPPWIRDLWPQTWVHVTRGQILDPFPDPAFLGHVQGGGGNSLH